MSIDIFDYCESHDINILEGVLQFLEVFDCCEELKIAVTAYLKHNKRYIQQQDRITAYRIEQEKEYLKQERMTDEDGAYPGEPPEPPVIGFCPDCGGLLGGLFISPCETKKTGRYFYRECSECSHFVEMLKHGDKYTEVKGE